MRKSQKQLEEANRQLACNIRYMKEEHGTKNERCAQACHISPASFSRRLNNPGDFSFAEINQLANLWNIAPTKLMYGKLMEGEELV